MYSLNERIVYPGYGVAKINQIIEKNVVGKVARFYELKFINREMVILIPVDNVSSIGIRKLCSSEIIDEIFNILSQAPIEYKEPKMQNPNSWNKRNKNYQVIIRSGNLIELTKIYKDLQSLSKYKELSFGERALLLQVEALISEEISFVKNIMMEEAIMNLRTFFEVNDFNKQRKLYQEVNVCC